jgi:hypothetical protein
MECPSLFLLPIQLLTPSFNITSFREWQGLLPQVGLVPIIRCPLVCLIRIAPMPIEMGGTVSNLHHHSNRDETELWGRQLQTLFALIKNEEAAFLFLFNETGLNVAVYYRKRIQSAARNTTTGVKSASRSIYSTVNLG